MSRLVEAKVKSPRGSADLASGGDPWQGIKEYGERVAKYIPAEVVAFYTTATDLILTKEGDTHKALRLLCFAIVGIIAWIGTPAYLSIYSKDPKTRTPNQIIGFI